MCFFIIESILSEHRIEKPYFHGRKYKCKAMVRLIEESINKLKKILRVYLIESVALSRRRTSLASKMP